MLTMLLAGSAWRGLEFFHLGVCTLYILRNHLWQRGVRGYLVGKNTPKGSHRFTTVLSWASHFSRRHRLGIFRARTQKAAADAGGFSHRSRSSAYASPGILRLMDLRFWWRAATALDRVRSRAALHLAWSANVPNSFAIANTAARRAASLLRWRPNGRGRCYRACARVSLFACGSAGIPVFSILSFVGLPPSIATPHCSRPAIPDKTRAPDTHSEIAIAERVIGPRAEPCACYCRWQTRAAPAT